ncbi:MAG: energy transducer TonB [Deltaproteobacteria bacterium]|nr:energy transducer TonB [Deltaproteobacteria bacterium]
MEYILSKKRSLFLWFAGIAGSLVFNIFLFSIMPSLVSEPLLKKGRDDIHLSVNMVRVKPPRKPPPEKQKKKIEPKTKVLSVKEPLFRKKIKIEKIPFEINAKFPSGPVTLTSPPAAHFDFSAIGLKDFYGIGEIDGTLVPIVQVQPVYPMRAKSMGIEGWVKIKFMVNRKGLVENIRIVRAVPEGVFEKCVKRCLSAWRFSPGTVEGETVNTQVITTIRFNLE